MRKRRENDLEIWLQRKRMMGKHVKTLGNFPQKSEEAVRKTYINDPDRHNVNSFSWWLSIALVAVRR